MSKETWQQISHMLWTASRKASQRLDGEWPIVLMCLSDGADAVVDEFFTEKPAAPVSEVCTCGNPVAGGHAECYACERGK